ncbi:amidohydrolase family protein [Roseibium sp.]|uniref:metal-dependent hydrolase family protein n=1 Tax=Roseibium sp. TaxID=1936156 RepID=UPI003D13EA92
MLKRVRTGFLALVLAGAATPAALAQDKPPQTLITNVHVFDGKTEQRSENASVLIEGNLIKSISTDPISADGATVIDGGGRTLMPGLIDAHVHLWWNTPVSCVLGCPESYLTSLALKEAEATLMRGYTTVRDTSGPVLGMKRAIDEGLFPGPRIYASAAGLGMTSGHADFRTQETAPRILGGPAWTDVERAGMSVLVDGVPEVLAGARMQMRKGAHFLKAYVSGAVSGLYDPLDITEFSFDEVKAAADEAKRWNTYLAVHTYTDHATQQALNAGAMSIEHATIITKQTMKLLVEKGAYLSTQTGVYLQEPAADWNDDQKAKQLEAQEGLDRLMKLAKQYGAKIAIGTDLVGVASEKYKQAFELTNRLKWFTPFEILNQAMVNNAELMSWSGPRNPYKEGPLGVIAEGAYADILLVNGNPLEDLTLLNRPEESLALIMKDGVIYKNMVE